MNPTSEKVKARLRKLLTLAQRGEGGEKEKAANLLARLLHEHGLTMADLEREDAPRFHRDFAYQTQFEERLLHQIAGQVLNTNGPDSWRYRDRSKIIIFDLTEIEYLEMKMRWKIYRAAWKKEQERLYIAFLHAQNIFPDSPQEATEDSTDMDDAELEALRHMVSGITPVSVRRPLPAEVTP